MIFLTGKLTAHFQSGTFFRNFIILGSGTALAQIIPILASPILTRLYNPADFAMLAVFMSLVGTFTPIICGKYEVALVLPNSRMQAEQLLGIALWFALTFSATLFLIFFFTGNSILSLLNADNLGNWIFAVPVALLLTGFFTATNYYANREKDYGVMARSKITKAFFTSLTSIMAGVLGAQFGGLLTGFFTGIICASFYIFFQYHNLARPQLYKWGKMKKWLLCKYRHYPLYNATSGLLDGLTLSLPILFLSRYFPENTVGYYSLVFRVSLAPVAFISATVSQINLKKVVELINQNRSPIPYLLKLSLLLAAIILLPSIIIFCWGPEIFRLVFGWQWSPAGEYARILIPAIAVQFVASTLSSTFGATNNNRLGAIWKIMAFISTTAVFAWLAPKREIILLLQAFTINNIVLYLLYFAAILFAAHTPRNFQ